MQLWKSNKIARGIVLATLVGVVAGSFWYTRHVQQQLVVLRAEPFVLDPAKTAGQGAAVQIYGKGFRNNATIWFYQTEASQPRVLSAERLSAVFPKDVMIPGWYDILVKVSSSRSAILENGIGVRATDGTIPERHFAIRREHGVLTYAAEGKVTKQGNAVPSYDNYPNISVGSYSLASIAMSPYAQTYADRYDYVLGVTTGDVSAINAHVQSYPHADMTEYNNGLPQTGRDGHTDAKITSFVSSYNASHDPDIQAEDFYLHAKCDCDMLYGTMGHCKTYSASDPQCTKTAGCPYSFITGTKTQYQGWNSNSPGNPNTGCLASTATSRAASRMMSAYLPQWDVPNYAFPQLADFFASTFQNENIVWAGGSNLVSGVFLDTVVKDNPIAFADGMHMSWEYWGADVRSATTPAQPFYDYFTLQQNVRTKLSSNVGQNTFRYPGNVITIPNEYPLSIYTPDTLASVQDNFVEIFFDHYKNPGNTYQGECGQWKSFIDETKNKGEKFFLNSYERVGAYCSGGSTYDCRTNRGKIESLAMYYLLQNNLTTYLYAAETEPFTPDALWNSAVTIDLGDPTTMPADAKDIFGNTGTDDFYNYDDQAGGFTCPVVSTTPTNIVYARNYTDGLVLVKHRYDWSDSVVYGDESSSDTTKKDYALGGYFHPVNADGTLGAMVNSVALRNSEGAILLTNRVPQLDRVPDRAGLEDQAISFTVTANDPDGDVVTLSAQNIPAGAIFLADGPGQATFSWTPSWTQSGTYSVDFIATDGQAAAVQTVTFSIADINRLPAFDPIGDKVIRAGDTLTFSVTAADPDRDPLTYSASSLPEGAIFQNATLTWTPTSSQVGRHDNIRFNVSDGKSDVTTTVSITVEQQTQPLGGNNIPVLTVPASFAIDENTAVKAEVTATDSDGDTISLTAADMPTGAAFSDLGGGVGSFSWTPSYSQQGAYSVQFAASDGKEQDTKTAVVTVRNVNRAPALDPIGDKTADVDTLLQFPVNATDPDGDTIALEVQNLPTDATINKNAFTWKPSKRQIGTHTLTFSASDGSATASETVHMQVKLASGVRMPSGGSQDATNPAGAGGTFPASTNFYAYSKIARTGYTVATGNVWGDQRDEIITGTGSGQSPLVRIFSNDGKLRRQFYAFPRQFTTGVRVASCDLDGDGREEILAAPGPGSIPQVRILNSAGKKILSKQIWGLDGKYKGGINIACADVNGDGNAEIIIAPSTGTGPQVTIHQADGRRIGNFRAYAATFRGGVAVSAADVNGDGRAEIVTAPEQGANPVRFFTLHGKSVRQDLWPFGRSFGGGLNVRVGNLDGQGALELVVVPHSHAQSRVKIFSAATQRVLKNFLAYSADYSGGAQLAVGDVDGDGVDDVVTIPAGRTSSLVKLFSMDGKPL